jgi:NADPH:quinone reductase-like Zn-dependent oxidoreductase
MKAIRVHFTDSGSTLRMDEVPKPEPREDQVLIKAQAIGLNRADLGRRRTAQPGQPEPPVVPGLDVAGVVESVGKDVRGWQPGDQVTALVRGAYAEYVPARAVLAYYIPRGMSITDAASLPCVFLTAWYALTKLAGLKRGETALIHAAGSGVGMAGIQIAKALGARVLTSAGSDERVKRGLQLGADAGINYSTQNVAAELRRLTSGKGVDVALDSVGGAVFDATLASLSQGGRIVTVGGHAGQRAAYDEKALAAKGQWVKAMGVFNEAAEDAQQQGWAQLKAWFEEGKLRTIVQQVLPWTQAEQAQKLLTERGVFGKLVLRVA